MKYRTTLITLCVLALLLCGATIAYRYFTTREAETTIQNVTQDEGSSRSADAGEDSEGSAADSAASGDDGSARSDAADSDGTADAADAASSDADATYMPNLSLLDSEGVSTTYAQVADGKPGIINLWTTWCPYCVDELDDYQSLYESYGSKIQFLIVDLPDGTYETIDGAKDYVAEHSYTFPVYFDTAGTSLTAFGTSGIPVTAIANAEGEMVYYHVGRMDTDEVEAVLAGLAS